jgi:hypothetical protein
MQLVLERSYGKVLVGFTSRELVFVSITRGTSYARTSTVTLWARAGSGEVRGGRVGLPYGGVRTPAPLGLALLALWDPRSIDIGCFHVAQANVTVKVLG